MDEAFHVPLASRFVAGNFEWDPLVTTPPGLYIGSMGWLYLLDGLGLTWPILSKLRALNHVFALGTFWVLVQLLKSLNPTSNKHGTRAFVISLFPIAFFYHFLFYTDSGSTFFVLTSYLLSLRGYHALSGLCGGISVCFRQTNIIWVFFIAATGVLSLLKKKRGSAWHDRVVLSGPLYSIGNQVSLLKELIVVSLGNINSILKQTWSHLLVFVSFVGFIYWNNGIVLGDKSNHVPGLHFPQLFYFFAFSAFFGFFALNPVGSLRPFISIMSRRVSDVKTHVFIVVASILSYLAITHFTIEHPFILSDNRHFIFYIWRYILKVPSVRLALIPGYLYVIWVSIYRLSQCQTYLWIAFYLISVSAVLVPTPLIEFRYFILPYLFLRLHVPSLSKMQLMGEFILNIVVSGIVFHLFFFCPFQWPGLDAPQRFMW